MQKAADRVGKKRITPEELARLNLIEAFTDAASSLLSTEADIFEQHREELEHSLRMSSILRDPAVQSSGANHALVHGYAAVVILGCTIMKFPDVANSATNKYIHFLISIQANVVLLGLKPTMHHHVVPAFTCDSHRQ